MFGLAPCAHLPAQTWALEDTIGSEIDHAALEELAAIGAALTEKLLVTRWLSQLQNSDTRRCGLRRLA